MNFKIIPYEKKYDDRILEMEKDITQGKSVQLEIIKNNFTDRASVFRKYHALVGIASDDAPVATCIGAQTKIGINGTSVDAGYGFEAKVHPAHRKKGLGKLMARELYSTFFEPHGLTKVFTTLKRSNIPIVRLLTKAIPSLWFYDFVYLTIPCQERLTSPPLAEGGKQLLTITLFDDDELDPSFFSNKKSGLGYFNTFKMYQLKIGHLSWLWKLAVLASSKINPRKHAMFPAVGDTFTFATLFNHTASNIVGINEVLEELSQLGVHFLMVCCRRNDHIFRTLRKVSINTYDYYLVSDFPLSPGDEVTLDVRCL